MNSLVVRDGKLYFKIESDILQNNINKSFFVNSLGFNYDQGQGGYVYAGKITPDLIETVVEFVKMCNVPYSLDTVCESLIQQNVKQRDDFSALRDKGAAIKKKANQRLNIPIMQPKKKLKYYQIPPVIHASTLGAAANFSVPGSGKTWMGYAAYFLLKSRKEVEKLLVIGPLSSFRPWETEYFEMTGKDPNSIRISGSPARRREIFRYADQYEIFLMSYQTAQIENAPLKELLQKYKFMVIVDESHHIKNPYGEWANAVLSLSPYAVKRMILSGTPLPNKVDDLWTQFTFLYPDQNVLGDFITFQFEASKENALKELSQKLYPFYTRVSKKTLDLPRPKFVRMSVEMSPIQKRIYDAIKGYVRKNDSMFRNDAIAMQQFRTNSIIYLLEASTDPSLLTKSSQYRERTIDSQGLPIQQLVQQYENFEVPRKIQAVKKLVEQSVSKGEKIIVWCSFVPTILKLFRILEKYGPLMVWGAVPKDEEEDPTFNRENEIDKFKNSEQNHVLIANPASLAESVSLHKVCHHAVYLDRTFNGGHYMQSLERIHRIGIEKTAKTRYTILMSKHSIDEIIDERLQKKIEKMLAFLNEEDFGKLDLDLEYGNAFGEEDELIEDYRRVYDHIMKD